MPESQLVEWKASWSDKYLKWVCGFANAQGGQLVIGTNDEGKVVGINNARKLLEDIPNQVRDLMGILVDTNLHQENELDYLVINVESYPYPISLRGNYYYRSGSTLQELKNAKLDQFLLRKQGKHWDSMPIPNVPLADFSIAAFELFREKARNSRRLTEADIDLPDQVLMEKLRLFDANYIKRAAILLFHKDAECYVSGAYVKIGYFESNTDLMYQDEIHGDLFTQVDKTLDLLLTKYSKAMISYKGSQRIETFPVPPVALREAIINAIVHKDYALATPIQISVYENKIMIWNAGQLPEDWTLDTLFIKHSSIPHNPDIANAFFRAGLIESWGRGIEKIIKACVDANLPAPEFRYEQGGMWAEFGANRLETDSRLTLGVKHKQILDLLRKQPTLSIKDIANSTNHSIRTTERAIKLLRESGYLQRIGPTKRGQWEITDDPET